MSHTQEDAIISRSQLIKSIHRVARHVSKWFRTKANASVTIIFFWIFCISKKNSERTERKLNEREINATPPIGRYWLVLFSQCQSFLPGPALYLGISAAERPQEIMHFKSICMSKSHDFVICHDNPINVPHCS